MSFLKVSPIASLMNLELFLQVGSPALAVFSFIETKLSDDYTAISIAEISENVPLSQRTIKEYIHRLSEFLLIEIKVKPGYCNQYKLGPLATKLYSMGTHLTGDSWFLRTRWLPFVTIIVKWYL